MIDVYQAVLIDVGCGAVEVMTSVVQMVEVVVPKGFVIVDVEYSVEVVE